jgi:hypothetical protein
MRKIGAWAASKIAGASKWKELKGTEQGQQLIASGLTKKGVVKASDRHRLRSRCSYVLLLPASVMKGNKRLVALHESQLWLSGLASLMSGKMGREEAVDRLFEDLMLN